MSPAQPWFVLVGGINGSGKSTFAQDKETLATLVGDDDPQHFEIINPDLVTKEIRRTDKKLSLAEANLLAAQECERRVDQFLKSADRSFAIETVLSTDKYVARVKKARAAGFQVLFVYMLLASPDQAVERVAIRVANGGHDVPEPKIRARWPRSISRLPTFFKLATRSLVFFNGGTGMPIRVAERAEQFASFRESVPSACAPALRSLLPSWWKS